MNRVFMSSVEFGRVVLPTHIFGSSRCADTMQMAITAGSIANAAHLNTSAILSPAVLHSSGTQCQASLAVRKNTSAKIQFPTSTKRNGHWYGVNPRYLIRGSRRALSLGLYRC